MPELPEVETVCLALSKILINSRVTNIEIFRKDLRWNIKDNLEIDLKQKIKEKRNLIRENFFKNLKLIGYRYFKIKTKNPTDRMIIKAFQMRYFPEKVTGKIDKKTYILSQLLAQK